MATFNGSLYIERQLRSILCQLESVDEIILVDDHSSDKTLDVVERVADERIKIYRNDFNKGVVLTFEQAIRLASGSVIFLSDQDDIWYPEKVRRFLDVFSGHPEITLVLSDAKIINNVDEVIAESFLESRGGFSPSIWHNVVKNKYLGCSMAFRRSAANRFLPFPTDIPMHDVWIGCVNSIYEPPYFLDIALIGYRRHQHNVTPTKRRGLAQILASRWYLAKNLCVKFLVRNKV